MDFRCRKEFSIKTWMLTNYLDGKEEQVLGWLSRNAELAKSCQYLWGHNWIYEFKNTLRELWPRRVKAEMKTRCCCHHDNWLLAYKAGDRTPKCYFICIVDLHDSLASPNRQNVVDSNWWTLFCLQNYGCKKVQKEVNFLTFQLLKQEGELNEDCRDRSRVPYSVVHTV